MLYALSIAYGINGFIYLFIAVRGILKKNTIRLFDLARLMYAFTFGLVPSLIYLQEANGERNLFFYDYSSEGLWNIVLMYFSSLIVYAVMNLAYFSAPRIPVSIQQNNTLSEEKRKDISNRLLLCSTIMLILGGISFYLWTRAFGSINNFILNAAAIRSGTAGVYNRFAFMKQFVRILPLSLYAILSAYYYERPQSYRRFLFLFLAVASIIGNFYYFLASDSRMTIILIGIGILVISLKHRKRYRINGYLLRAAIIAFVLLVATMLADVFTHYIRYNTWEVDTDSLINHFTREFRFVVTADMKSIRALMEGDLKLQIGNDLLNALTAWVPVRFIPFKVPETLWTYNTNLYGGSGGSGTSPSGIVSTSIYEFGIIGPVVFPFLFGRVTASADNLILKQRNMKYAEVYYAVSAGLFAQMIPYNQISSFVASLFPVFLFFLITKVIDHVRLR